MSRKEINVGTSANKGDGDPLRTAFKKINENFAELYTGGFVEPDVMTSTLAPDTDGEYDLGKIDKRWTDIYVKDFIYLNGSTIELTPNGTLLINGGPPAERQDTVGSVFADDSTVMVDGITGKVVGPVDTTTVNAVTITATSISGDLTGNVTGNVTGTAGAVAFSGITGTPTTLVGYGITDAATSAQGALADTALQSYTVTESDVTTHETALSITESQITDLAHYDDTALATRVTTLENAGYITSETDSQELTLVGTDLSISSGNTVDLSGFLTSVPAQTFASLTGTPTTIAGYGITDALVLGITSTTALAGDTALFSGDYDDLTNKPTIPTDYGDHSTQGYLTSETDSQELTLAGTDLSISGGNTVDLSGFLTSVPAQTFASLTGTPTTIAGYGITDALVTGNSAGTAAPYNLSLDNIADANGNALLTTHQFAVSETYTATPTIKYFEVETGAGTSRMMRSGINMSTFGQSVAPVIDLRSYRASPADGDAGPELVFRASTAGSSNAVIATFKTKVIATAWGAETTEVSITTDNAGTSVTPFKITGNTVYSASHISIADLKTLVAASADFADFQTRIAAL